MQFQVCMRVPRVGEKILLYSARATYYVIVFLTGPISGRGVNSNIFSIHDFDSSKAGGRMSVDRGMLGLQDFNRNLCNSQVS